MMSDINTAIICLQLRCSGEVRELLNELRRRNVAREINDFLICCVYQHTKRSDLIASRARKKKLENNFPFLALALFHPRGAK